MYQDVDFARHRVKTNNFSNNKESPNFKIKKVPNVGCYLWFGFFSKDDLMQIDTTPGNMKRAQYKRWTHLVNSAQLDRH